MAPATMYQRLSDSWLRCGSGAGQAVENLRHRARKAREQPVKSNDGTTAPTHSSDSAEMRNESEGQELSCWPSIVPSKGGVEVLNTPGNPSALHRSAGTNSTKSSESSPKASAPPVTTDHTDFRQPTPWVSWPFCERDTTLESTYGSSNKGLLDYVDEVCSPCHPRNLAQSSLDNFNSDLEPSLGIGPMEAPTSGLSQLAHECSSILPQSDTTEQELESFVTSESPADRRRRRHANRLQRGDFPTSGSHSPHDDFEVTPTEGVISVPPLTEEQQTVGDSISDSTKEKTAAPLGNLTLDIMRQVELESSISELTMRSSYGVATAKLSDNRRMAYYAVGKNHRQSGRGGNRRCYFTGKLILSGAPFYAGSVEQGLRTLVVFCLPSSLGLPYEMKDSGSVFAGLEGGGSGNILSSGSSKGAGGRSILSQKSSRIAISSKMSYADEMSLSVGEELDPNWGLDKEYLLSVLPSPDQEVLSEMARRFPEQFETLPVQVRGHDCWRLYVKFCFFSGLPIAEGELHYKVTDDVADVFGEEVILSHDVMEAVNGHDSAQILRLPNLKTFRYLRKHYNQQSEKLPNEVFQRNAWELVRPEV